MQCPPACASPPGVIDHFDNILYYLGLSYEKNGNSAKSEEWYRKAAEQGHPQAWFELGKMYYHGQGVYVDDKEAEKCLVRGSIRGLASLIQYYLDVINENRKAIGKKASDFTLQIPTGECFNLYENLGKPVFLHFWDALCTNQMPDIEKLQLILSHPFFIGDDELYYYPPSRLGFLFGSR